MCRATRRQRATMAQQSTSTIVPRARLTLLTSMLLLASGCSREVPSTWSSDSPASAEAPAVPLQDVTLSLDGDPPLPGETATGWHGLEQPTAAPDHSGHSGHSGHAEHGGHAGHAGHGGHGEEPAKSESPEPSTPAAEPKQPAQPKPKQPAKPKPAPQPTDEHADHDGHAGHAMPEEKGAHHHGH
jgi:hypothetical protein